MGNNKAPASRPVKRKHKTRKVSIQFQIMVPAAVIIVLICVAMGFMFNSRMSNDMVISGGELADYVGKLTVDKINGSLVTQLKAGAEGSAPYKALEVSLDSMMEDSAIKSMKILYKDGDKVYCGLDKGPNPVAAGTEFCSYDRLHQAFEGYSIRRTGIDKGANGAVISAYRPIYDRTMNLVGVLACDYDAEGIVKALNNTLRNVIIFGIICVLVAVLVIHLITSRVTKHLWMVDDKLCDIVSSNGDLTQTINVRTGDEVESIAGHVNELLVYIRDIMSRIFENSKELNLSSESVANHLKDTQDSVTEVSATMEEMSATMQQTATSINEISGSVNDAYSFIGDINERVHDGEKLTGKIRESVAVARSEAIRNQEASRERIAEISKNVNDKIVQSKSAEKITELTADIINIADQTSLLSLNASIEAARAGEAGRGFAVVAGEIGNLSTNSATAAEQIKQVSAEVLNAVNALAEEATMLLDVVEETAMKGYSDLVSASEQYNRQAEDLNQMMNKFGSQAAQLQDNMDNIREVMVLANTSIEESTKSITRITEMSVNITENVSDIEGQAGKNKNIAGMLDGEVNKFRID